MTNKHAFCNDFSHDQIDQYDEMLNDCHEEIKIGDLTFDPADVIFNCDPIAYRCGLIDHIDSIDEE